MPWVFLPSSCETQLETCFLALIICRELVRQAHSKEIFSTIICKLVCRIKVIYWDRSHHYLLGIPWVYFHTLLCHCYNDIVPLCWRPITLLRIFLYTDISWNSGSFPQHSAVSHRQTSPLAFFNLSKTVPQRYRYYIAIEAGATRVIKVGRILH